jgi:hypothetical protein
MIEYTVKVFNNKTAWYLNGKFHREDGPAIECTNGDKEWFINGELHRTNGPAIEHANGDKTWWFNGKLHREDGPAVEWADGTEIWYLNGKRHREDGPALKKINGYSEYWLKDKRVTEDEVVSNALAFDIETLDTFDMMRMYVLKRRKSDINNSCEYSLDKIVKEYILPDNSRTIIIDGKEIKISNDSFNELKKQLIGE